MTGEPLRLAVVQMEFPPAGISVKKAGNHTDVHVRRQLPKLHPVVPAEQARGSNPQEL